MPGSTFNFGPFILSGSDVTIEGSVTTSGSINILSGSLSAGSGSSLSLTNSGSRVYKISAGTYSRDTNSISGYRLPEGYQCYTLDINHSINGKSPVYLYQVLESGSVQAKNPACASLIRIVNRFGNDMQLIPHPTDAGANLRFVWGVYANSSSFVLPAEKYMDLCVEYENGNPNTSGRGWRIVDTGSVYGVGQ